MLSKVDKFSDAQAVTATAISETIQDLGPNDTGPGEPIQLQAWVEEDFNLLTSLRIDLETHTSDDFSSQRTVLLQTGEVPLADLVAGYQFKLGTLPIGLLRYVALRYTVTGTNPTSGIIGAGLSFDRQANNPDA
jgi:hypothetical protein